MKSRPLFLLCGLLVLGLVGLLMLNGRTGRVPADAAHDDIDIEALRKSLRRPVAGAARPFPSAAPRANDNVSQTNRLSLILRMLAGEDVGDESTFKLTREQLDAYLAKSHRSPESLLAAAQLSDLAAGAELLREAAEKFPDDPQVQFAILTAQTYKLGLTTEDRRKWLEAFKQGSPNNALPGLLSAREYFKADQPQEAVREVAEALTRRGYHDFTLEAGQNLEEAYLSGGYSVAEAKTIANCSVLLPQLSELKQVGVALADLEKQYRAAGDTASADRLFATGLQMAQLLTDERSPSLIKELVGLAIERRFLTNYSTSQPALQQLFAQVEQRRQAIREVTTDVNTDTFLQGATETDIITYWDRMRLYGEYNALLWLKARQSNPP